jgi:hypothetical protein
VRIPHSLGEGHKAARSANENAIKQTAVPLALRELLNRDQRAADGDASRLKAEANNVFRCMEGGRLSTSDKPHQVAADPKLRNFNSAMER